MRRILSVGLVSLLLLTAGCSTKPPLKTVKQPPPVAQPDLNTVDALLQRAIQAKDPVTQASYRLQAADILLQQNNIQRAEEMLSLIDYRLMPQEVQEQYMLIALVIAEQQADTDKVATLLSAIPEHFYQQVPLSIQRKAGEIKAAAYNRTAQYLLAAKERIYSSALYSGDEYWDNHELIWQSLREAPTAQLSQYRKTSGNYELQGWFQLATRIKQNQIDLEQQLAALSLWLEQWPQHPAALKLPAELELLATLPERRPGTIALALPLTGALSHAGKAIRDGFLATYYADKYHSASKTQITFYDTNDRLFTSVYQEILDDSPDFVIGPLDKTSLIEVSQMANLPIPVLALNYLSEQETHIIPAQLYQFGLSAEDEVHQLADRLWSKGARQVVTIMPDSDWGERIYQAFSNRWLSRNGEIVEKAFFKNRQQLSKVVERLLAVDESKQRARSVRNTIVESLEFTPRRRLDIDAIVMIAKPEVARQLKPLFAFHYAGNIPVYSSSLVYAGTPSKQKDADLNGIQFTETPWTLSQTNAIKHQIHQLFPQQSQRYDRLFALGSDAYRLTPRLILLERVTGSQVSGQTGLLTMNEKKRIHRTLDWARFVDGVPRSER